MGEGPRLSMERASSLKLKGLPWITSHVNLHQALPAGIIQLGVMMTNEWGLPGNCHLGAQTFTGPKSPEKSAHKGRNQEVGR